MSSPTSAEPALLAVAPRRQNRGTCDERDRATCSQLRRGGLFGVQRGNKERSQTDLCLRIQDYLPPRGGHVGGVRRLVRTRVIPRWRDRRSGNRPIVMG